jgi:hypothetical protein
LAFSPAEINEIYFSLRRQSRRNEKYILFIPVGPPEAGSKSSFPLPFPKSQTSGEVGDHGGLGGGGKAAAPSSSLHRSGGLRYTVPNVSTTGHLVAQAVSLR